MSVASQLCKPWRTAYRQETSTFTLLYRHQQDKEHRHQQDKTFVSDPSCVSAKRYYGGFLRVFVLLLLQLVERGILHVAYPAADDVIPHNPTETQKNHEPMTHWYAQISWTRDTLLCWCLLQQTIFDVLARNRRLLGSGMRSFECVGQI